MYNWYIFFIIFRSIGKADEHEQLEMEGICGISSKRVRLDQDDTRAAAKQKLSLEIL